MSTGEITIGKLALRSELPSGCDQANQNNNKTTKYQTNKHKQKPTIKPEDNHSLISSSSFLQSSTNFLFLRASDPEGDCCCCGCDVGS